MNKKILAWLVCFALTLALLPAQAALAADPVCEIVGGAQYDTLDEAVAAIPADTPTTIRLLTDINRTSTLAVNTSKKITLDLNGYTLAINAASGSALEVNYGGSLTTAGAGAMNLSGVLYGIDANQGGSADITGSVTATGDTGDHTNGKGINACDSGVSVTVSGDVAGDMCGVDAYNGAIIHVTGSVTGHNVAVGASAGGQVHVTGNVSGSGVGVQADSAMVEIGGTVTASGSDGCGVLADHASTVTIGAGVTAVHQGILAKYQSDLTVTGGVSVTNGANEGVAVIAETSSTISVDGSVTGGACGADANTGAEITITGNISSYYCGINTANGAEVFVQGNVVADGTVGVGVNAYSTGEATIDGAIQAHEAMTFGESDGAQVIPTTKAGYLTYSDGGDYPSFVWVKAIVIPVLPAVVTHAVDSSAVTQTTAPVSGAVTAQDGVTVTERGFVCGLLPDPTLADGMVQSGSGTGLYSATLAGLTPGTAYHVRAYAVCADGTVYGEDRTFTTLNEESPQPAAPTVVTGTAAGVTASGASVSGTVASDGGAEVSERGFVYGTSAEPTMADGKVTAGSGTGDFNAELTGLAAGTTYYVRSYAINDAGTAYGQVTNFTTAVSQQTGDNPKTGDESLPLGWIASMLAAGMLLWRRSMHRALCRRTAAGE